MSTKWIVVATMVLAAGCGDVCTRNSDCHHGLLCGPDATCIPPATDAGVDIGPAPIVDGGADAKSVDLDPAHDLDPARDLDPPPDFDPPPDLDQPRDLLPAADLDPPQDLAVPVDLLNRIPLSGAPPGK